MNALLIFLGGGVGALARYGATLACTAFGNGFPWTTLSVNLLGSFLIGFLAPLLETLGAFEGARYFLLIGILGGFTTFSAFSYENAALLREGHVILSFLYSGLSVCGGIAACYAGLGLARLGLS